MFDEETSTAWDRRIAWFLIVMFFIFEVAMAVLWSFE